MIFCSDLTYLYSSKISLLGVGVPTKVDPKTIPPPTPVKFPRCDLEPHDSRSQKGSSRPTKPLIRFLQSIHRPTELKIEHLESLGINVTTDVSPESLLPDPNYFPDFASWDKLSIDEARDLNHETRRPLNNGNLSPGCQTYLDRKRELSYSNEDGFRTVRRIPAPKGKQQARLGNSYEFFRCLETLTTFWNDTAEPLADGPDEPSGEAMLNEKQEALVVTQRTAAGSAMPGEFRHNLLTAFLKLVAYDFGCNVSAPRTEPRLHLMGSKPGEIPPPLKRGSKRSEVPARNSYFSSACTFVFRTPTTREAARAGIVQGPLAAVSPRATTAFETESDSVIDLSREILAALITAQHRAREGRTEKKFGEGAWWTTKPRWGGGSGGPIGREIEKDEVQGYRDGAGASSEGIQAPVSKKPRKNMSMYDNYRMVRPPSASWDKKTKYEAIGKQKGATYDDVYVISCLFHHVSVLRVRVPNRLLEVLDGADEGTQTCGWGTLEVHRSRWFDLFIIEERIAAMQMIWGMMAYLMKKDTSADAETDVKMTDA
jgi:hypothetical protein